MVQPRAYPGPGLGAGRPVRPPLSRHRRHAALCRALSPELARNPEIGRMAKGGGHTVDAEAAAAFPRHVADRVPPLHARAVAPHPSPSPRGSWERDGPAQQEGEGRPYIKNTPFPV